MKQDPERRAGVRAVQVAPSARQARPVTGAFTADGDGMALDTLSPACPTGPFRNLVAAVVGRRDRADGRAAGRRLGRVRDAQARRVGAVAVLDRSPARSAARPSRRRSSRRPASTSSRTSSPGSATPASSCAAPTGEPRRRARAQLDRRRAGRGGVRQDRRADRQADRSRSRAGRVEGAEAAFALPLPDTPKPIVLARGEGRVVAALRRAGGRARRSRPTRSSATATASARPRTCSATASSRRSCSRSRT